MGRTEVGGRQIDGTSKMVGMTERGGGFLGPQPYFQKLLLRWCSVRGKPLRSGLSTFRRRSLSSALGIIMLLRSVLLCLGSQGKLILP